MEKPSNQIDKEKVARLMTYFVRQHMFMDIDYSDSTTDRYIVNAKAALAIGILPNGEIPESVREEDLEKLVEGGIDPTLN